MATTTFVIANNVSTTLATAAASGATTLTLASSANLPVLSAGQVMPLTLNDAATGQIYEVVYVTAISGVTLTVTRAQEGTGAQNWNIGDFAYVAPTAGTVCMLNGNPANQFQVAPATASNQAVALSQLDGYTSFISLPGSSTLTASQCGSLISAPASTQTLPALSTLARNGQAITIRASSATGPATVLTSGTDVISIAGTSVATYSIPSGYEAKFTRQSSTTWTVDGTSLANNLPLPVAPATASGHAPQFSQVNPGRLLNIQTFSANATYTPTTGTNKVIIKAVGAGGGGGGVSTASSGQAASAAGGGAGAYAEGYFTSGFSGIPLTIGTAGSAGASGGGNGGNGGTTSAGSLITATGGSGGTGSTAGSTFPTFLGGGFGSAATSGANLVSAKGGDSPLAIALSSTQAQSGAGGQSQLGSGASGRATGGAASGPGSASPSAGGGGSGALALPGAPANAGGAGGGGYIIIFEYA
jgi:hypothetical protein